jgi:hypothetical protein
MIKQFKDINIHLNYYLFITQYLVILQMNKKNILIYRQQ